MCPHKPDREETELLQELQRLQAREPLLDIEPPALMDQAVRNMARRELHHQSTPVAGKLGWIAGLSTVSIALIALGISLVQTPSATGPVNDSIESFESQKLESSRSERSDLASPAAPQLSRSAQAPATDTAPISSLAAKGSAEGSESDGDALQAREKSAQAWLDLIEQLRAQGLHAEALEQLSAWQQQYPDLPLPDWATALLPVQP